MNSAIIQHVMNGNFRAASALARQNGLAAHTELSRTAEFLSATAWLADRSPEPVVRREAAKVLKAIAAISPRWVENAQPHPLLRELVPHTKPDFDRLMVRVLGDQGFYHPVDVPGIEGLVPPSRRNAPDATGAYHTAEWALVRPLLERACGGSLRDRLIVDAGCADGFFALNLARAGAHVVAVDIAVTMALRTATFAALNGLHDRITVQLGPVHALQATLARLRTVQSGPKRVDAVCALGLIYHFDSLVPPLEVLTGLGVPILLELHCCQPAQEGAFDPIRHRNPEPVSLPWLTAWLDGAGFDTEPVPAWRTTAERLAGRSEVLRQEMLLAVPKR